MLIVIILLLLVLVSYTINLGLLELFSVLVLNLLDIVRLFLSVICLLGSLR
jgi:hypothetical protein